MQPDKAEKGVGDISVAHLFLSFLRLGLTAFGGPTMVAYIGELSVKKKKWLDPETFKNGVALCQSIPGATAIQVAAYVGLKVRGGLGGCRNIYRVWPPGFSFYACALMGVYAAGKPPLGHFAL
ncbi:MAG TPA: chromate transporter [Syntrophorhabdaceae bacterium]|nr:chromate transporter [Syntrophorhabdaceae bacterium]HQM81174.1 chromate transporter [Syntrophorhabdaceae bacterium]HQM82440.1 chromate transporter [Syntrophorhabdaceae bacterium]